MDGHNEQGLAGLPQRIRALREKKGITGTQLAEKLHMSQGNISKWERGTGNPKLPELVKLADFFGVSLDWLITGKNHLKESGTQDYSVRDIGLMLLALTNLYEETIESTPLELKSTLTKPNGETVLITEKELTIKLTPNGNMDSGALYSRLLLSDFLELLGVVSEIKSPRKKEIFKRSLRQMLLLSGTELWNKEEKDSIAKLHDAAWEKYDPVGKRYKAMMDADELEGKRLVEEAKKRPYEPERDLTREEKEKLDEFIKWDKEVTGGE